MQNGTAAKENSMNFSNKQTNKQKFLHDPTMPFLDICPKGFK